jgi:hypothetical protein
MASFETGGEDFENIPPDIENMPQHETGADGGESYGVSYSVNYGEGHNVGHGAVDETDPLATIEPDEIISPPEKAGLYEIQEYRPLHAYPPVETFRLEQGLIDPGIIRGPERDYPDPRFLTSSDIEPSDIFLKYATTDTSNTAAFENILAKLLGEGSLSEVGADEIQTIRPEEITFSREAPEGYLHTPLIIPLEMMQYRIVDKIPDDDPTPEQPDPDQQDEQQ